RFFGRSDDVGPLGSGGFGGRFKAVEHGLDEMGGAKESDGSSLISGARVAGRTAVLSDQSLVDYHSGRNSNQPPNAINRSAAAIAMDEPGARLDPIADDVLSLHDTFVDGDTRSAALRETNDDQLVHQPDHTGVSKLDRG